MLKIHDSFLKTLKNTIDYSTSEIKTVNIWTLANLHKTKKKLYLVKVAEGE